jgi:DHA1 family tetracycline resistance protein-like MFS transporter
LILAWAPNYTWLVIGRIIAGITGASFTTASAYIADISTPETKTRNFGYIGIAFAIGFFIGPVIGGILGKISLHLPFIVTAVLCFINLAYGFFILPESLPSERRRPFDWKRCNPFSSLIQLSKYKSVGWLFLSYLLLYIGSHAVQSNWSYFNMYRFGWSEQDIGISLAVVGLLVGAVQGGLVGLATKYWGKGKSVYIGFGLYALGMFLFGTATSSWMMFVFLIPYCLGGISGPAIQTILSDKVPGDQQGELQGGLTSIQSVANIVGPILMNNLFTYFTSSTTMHLPGISFFVGSIFMLVSAYLSYLVLK